jgi:hypothetical protein
MSPDFINTLGFAMGSAWLSGVNLYATVVTLGLLQRFHLVQLPGSPGRAPTLVDYRDYRPGGISF